MASTTGSTSPSPGSAAAPSFKGFDGLRHLGGFNLAFYPGKQRLEEGMPFILDCAPTLGAYTADVGYSGALGHNLLQERLMDDLLIHRRTILDLVRERRPWPKSARRSTGSA